MSLTTRKENNERKEALLDFIRDHPGCKKEAVIEGTKVKLGYSHMVIRKDLKELEDERRITVRRINRQLYSLYVNQENKTNTIIQEVRDFKRSFSILLENVRRVYKEKYVTFDEFSKSREKKASIKTVKNLSQLQEYLDFMLCNTLGIYKYVFEKYTDMSISRWPQDIVDKDELGRLYANVYMLFKDMHIEFLGDAPPRLIAQVDWDYLGYEYYTALKDHGLHKHLERVLGSIRSWNVKVELFGELSSHGRGPRHFEPTYF